MSFSDAVSLALIQHYMSGVIGSGGMTVPTGVTVGLSSTTPTETGTNVTEPTDGAYARQAVTGWEVVSGPVRFRNTAAILFPTMAAAFTATHAVLYDQLGNYQGNFALNGGTGYVINAGVPFQINAQGLVADFSAL